MSKKRSGNLVRSLLKEKDPISDEVCKQLIEISRESPVLDFKETFNTTNSGDWCELIKDLVAMANTDGGYILVGAFDDGSSSGHNLTALTSIDQAVIVDKISKYTDLQPNEVNVRHYGNGKKERVIFHVGASNIPIVFCKPGTYAVSTDKQKTAFSTGTIYFRHGSKSEPARQADIQRAFDSFFIKRKREILSGIKKVVKANSDEQILVLPRSVRITQDPTAPGVRLTDDPNAPPIRGIVGSGRYESVIEEMAGVMRNMQTDPEAYAATVQLWRFYASRRTLTDNPHEIKCLLVSSMYRRCPPYYWAWRMGPKKIIEFCKSEADKDTYPAINVAIRLAFAFGGDAGRLILESVRRNSKYLSSRNLAIRLLPKIGMPRRVWAEYPGKVARVVTPTGIRSEIINPLNLDDAERVIDIAVVEKRNRVIIKHLDAVVYCSKIEYEAQKRS